MASSPKTPQLPLLYKEVIALNSRDHASWRSRKTDKAAWLANQHAVPLTVEEFAQAQRHFPIIFSSGVDPVPLVLMGMKEGINVFVDGEGVFLNPVYVPAYARRYPYILAKIAPDASELSLCFDPSSDLVGDFKDGEALFDGTEPSEACKATLGFCEKFEAAGQATTAFVAELVRHDLLMEGELSIQQEGAEQPFVYRGFQMVNATKLRELSGDVLREWNQNGLLSLIFAHLHSLDLMREIFARQVQMGHGPTERVAA